MDATAHLPRSALARRRRERAPIRATRHRHAARARERAPPRAATMRAPRRCRAPAGILESITRAGSQLPRFAQLFANDLRDFATVSAALELWHDNAHDSADILGTPGDSCAHGIANVVRARSGRQVCLELLHLSG